MTDDVEDTSGIEVAQIVQRVNPLLEKLKKRMPGETYRLPSRGLFYTNGELDPEVEDGEVVVYPMTTMDELKMRSADMLFQGTAVIEVIGSCIPQILMPERLIASDVDFLLTCLRRVSYGPFLPVKYTCEHCGDAAEEADYNIPMDSFIRNAKEITKEQYDKMTVTLDDAYAVRLKPCTFKEMIEIFRRTNDDYDTAEKVSDWIDDSLMSIIRSVDKITDKEMIREWLKPLPRLLKEELSSLIEGANNWGIEFTYETDCRTCNKKIVIRTSMNPTAFFTLPSSPKTLPE